jgi:hypothetical protein
MCVLTSTRIGSLVKVRIAWSVFSATCRFSVSTISTPSGPKRAIALPPDASGCAGSRPCDPCSTNRFGDIFSVTMIWMRSHGIWKPTGNVKGPFPVGMSVIG